jgi:hypothetical protein
MKYFVLLATAMVFLAGCATSPVKISAALPVPSGRLLPAYTDLASGSTESKAPIIVIRDSGFAGSAATVRLYVDGSEIAELLPSEKVEFFLPVGEHIIGTLPKPALGMSMREEPLFVREVKPYHLRVSVVGGDGFAVRPSTLLD